MFDTSPVSVTDRALSQIKKIMKTKGVPSNYGLRIGIRGGGCAGPAQRYLGFDEAKTTDTIHEQAGLKLLFEKKDIMHLMGLVVDFEHSAEQSGFYFNENSPDQNSATQ